MEGSQPDLATNAAGVPPRGALAPDRPIDPGTAMPGILAWWRDAGVDLAFVDDPVDWLAEPPAKPSALAVLAAAVPAMGRPAPQAESRPSPTVTTELPPTLEAFAQWWMTEPTLDGGAVQLRVPPRGPVHARAMIVVAHPEAGDAERLLAGPEGALLAAMIRVMGLAEDEVYIASAVPRHMPLPDWQALAQAGFGRVLAHHIRLAAPERLIVLGRNILPLLGNDLPHNAQSTPQFNHEDFTVPLLGGMELASLLAQPRRKAIFWQQWLDWAETDGKMTA